MNKRLKHALALRKRGFAVLPLHHIINGACSCGSAKCGKHAGKHPRIIGGVNAASRSILQIKKWWREFPEANVAVATGRISNIIVLDVDPRNGGTSSMAARVAELGPLPKTARVITGDGEHLYFEMPDFPVKKDTKGKLLGDGIDTMSEGGYVVVPPSTHLSGKTYRHDKKRSLLNGAAVLPLPKAWQKRLRHGLKLKTAATERAKPQVVNVRKRLQRDQKSKAASAANKAKPQVMEVSTPVGTITTGKRNTSLTSKGGHLVRTALSNDAVIQALMFINQNSCKPPLPEEEVRKIAQSVIAYRATDINVQDRPEYLLFGTLLAEHFNGGDYIRHVQGHGFLTYDGRKWVLTERRLIESRILNIAEALVPARSGSFRPLISDVMHLLELKQTVQTDMFFGGLHRKPVINCANGELWINPEGQVDFRAHSPGSYLTHCLSVRYDEKAKCPRYDKALRQIFQKATAPKDMARHWNEVCGYIIQTERDIALIGLFLGEGANGKSELWQTLAALIGEQFVHSGSINQLDKNRFAIGSLRGKQIFVDDDVPAGTKLPDGALKKLSEGKLLTGELKGQDMFTFVNRAVPMLLANNEPSTADLSYGLQRRIMVIPFKHTFLDGVDLDRSLWPAIRRDELPGILNRYLAGLQRLRKRGSKWKLPGDVVQAQQDWFRTANPLRGFLHECCVSGAGRVLVSELFEAYEQWARDNGITFRLQRNTMVKQLKQQRFNIGRTNKGSAVMGLTLKASA